MNRNIKIYKQLLKKWLNVPKSIEIDKHFCLEMKVAGGRENMYKDVAKKILVGLLTVCMVAGMVDLTAFTVQAAGEFNGLRFNVRYTDRVEYNGSQHTPAVTIVDNDTGNTLTQSDFDVSYGENINAGSTAGTIEISGKAGSSYDGFTGSFTFEIAPKDFSISPDIRIEPIDDQYYNGAPVRPDVIVKDGAATLTGIPVEEAAPGGNYDYTYSFNNNAGPGQAAVTVTARQGSNYTGSKSANFTIIQRQSSLFQIDPIGDQAYDGGQQVRPPQDPVVKYDGETLTAGTDYELFYSSDRFAGWATVRAEGRNDYAGLETARQFRIVKSLRSNTSTEFTVTIQPKEYTGSPIQLTAEDITITDRDKPSQPLQLGEDFTLSGYNQNTNASDPATSVLITGIGAYRDSITKIFTIRPASLAGMEIEVEECTYNGLDQEPAVTVKKNNITYSPDDYEVNYSNNTNAGFNAGIIVTPKTGNLSGSKTQPFTINRLSLEDGNITMTIDYPENQEYNGTPIKPPMTLKYTQPNGTTVELVGDGTDYRERYDNAIYAVPGPASAVAIGNGNFTGERKIDYTINPQDLSSATITGIGTYTYSGGQHRPTIVVFAADGTRLTEYNASTGNGDYVVTYGENTNAGTDAGSVRIDGRNNYTGFTSATFDISKKDISSGVSISRIPVQTYTGSILRPEVTLTYNNIPLGSADFSLEWGEADTNLNASEGTAYVTIQGRGTNYTGSKTITFDIERRNIGTGDFLSLRNLDSVYDYTGGEIVATNLEVHYDNPDAGMSGMLLSEDYRVEYEANDVVGTARVKIVGEGNYSGSKTFDFAIKGNLEEADKTQITIPPQTYTGSPIDPEGIIVQFGTGDSDRVTLQQGRDYTVVDHSNNTEPGENTAGVVIEGINNYKGRVPVTFTINKKNLDDVTESSRDFLIEGIDPAGYEYTGYDIKPEPEITYHGVTLTSPGDYMLSYEENLNHGTATIIITGQGAHFEGSTRRTFPINPYDISKDGSAVSLSGVVENIILDDLAATDDVEMTGEGIVQTNLKVTHHCTDPADSTPDDRVLTEGEAADYTVSYERGNTREDGTGIVTVVITGQGNFAQTIRKDFKIQGDLEQNGTIEIPEEWNFIPEIGGECRNTPEPVVKYNGHELVRDTDYEVVYTANERVGTATVTVTARVDGYYIGTLTDTFEITPRVLSLEDENLVITGLEEDGYEYTGAAIVPELTITYMGVELDADDIEIIPDNNINVPGEGDPQPVVRITAKADGNYAGGVEIPFIIYPRTVSEDTIRIEGIAEGYDYNNGNEVRIPEGDLQLYFGEEIVPLSEGTDYDVSYDKNYEIGTATITLIGKGNYAGRIERNFYVMGDLNADYMDIQEIGSVPYGIVALTPVPVFKDNSSGTERTLFLGEHFEVIRHENNTNVASRDSENPPTVVIKGKNCYKGEYTEYFDIIPKNLSEDQGDITASFTGSINNDEVTDAFVYTGTEIRPGVTVYNHGQPMALGTDYTIREYVNNTNVPDPDAPEENRPGVVIDAVENGNYIGTKIIRFNIIPKDVSDVDITFTNESTFTYDRQEKFPQVSVTYVGEDGEPHDFPTENYRLVYRHNQNAGDPSKGEFAPMVVVVGKGNFTGEQVKPFTILPEDIGEDNPDITATATPAVYTGERATTTVTLTAADGTILGEGDYELGDYTDNIDAGTASVEVHGIGNYAGSRNVSFTIEPKSINSEEITVSPLELQEYTAAEIRPEPVVTAGTGDDAITLEKDEDYELTWRSNTRAGTGYVVITGKNNYGEYREEPFQIGKKSIGIDGVMDAAMTLEDIPAQQYTGDLVKPEISLSYLGEITETLKEGEDYTISCTSNIAVGTAEMTITGIGDFEGTINTSFLIKGNMANASVAEIPVQQYTGAEVKPLPTVIFAGKTLINDTDYEVSYRENVDRGTAYIIITGRGEWYVGSKTVEFIISREFSPQMKIAGLASSYTYTGKAITPSVRVTDYGSVLTEGRHYKLSYNSNVNAGTAKVTIIGMGEYSGSKSASYKIIERNVGQCSVTNIANQNYTGKKIAPTVKVSYGGRTLKSGSDYTIVYTNNVKAGRANAIIKGKGNFIGTKTIGYNIVIPKLSSVKGSGSASAIKISWKKNNTVTGYEIYTSSNRLVARMNKNKTSYTITKLKSGRTYAYKIRAYAVKDGATKRSSFVTLKVTTKPAATAITSIRSSQSKKVVLKWKKVSGATEYIVYRSTSKKGTYKSIGTTKKTSYTDSKATGGKTYYYKVRVRRTVDKKNYYSSYSAIKYIKAKK